MSPIPSATVEGTEYFGLTKWSGLTRDQTKCLSKVVYRHDDVALASPGDAEGFVQSRSGFAFTFKTKGEAVLFAEATAKCGAPAEFVYRSDRRLLELWR